MTTDENETPSGFSRREVLALGSAGLVTAAAVTAQPAPAALPEALGRNEQDLARAGHTPVTYPNGPKLLWRMVGNVKVFHLTSRCASA